MVNGEDEEDIDLTQDTAEDTGKSIQEEAEQRRAEAEAKKSKLERGYKFLKDKLKNTKFGKETSKVFGEISKAVSKLIAEILPIALILIMAIGLISFILNAPAMMRGKVADILSKVGETADHILFGDNGKFTPTELSLEKRIEILNYISSDLGIDIIGFGFVPTATYKDDGATQEIVSYESELNKIEGYQEGVDIPAWIGFSPATLIIGGLDVLFETIEYEGQQNEVIKEQADADLIYYYLIASERAFIRNEDGVIDTIFKGLDNWSGMLDISGDEGLDGVEVEVNRENETLEISANNGLFTEDNYVFSLDDWTGRYGMPLEFSLALHLSTMSSGLVKEMITNEDLQTEVSIGLNDVTCDAEFKINLKDEDGNIHEINLPYEAPDGKIESLYNKIVNGQSIEDADLSIQGLLYAVRQTEQKYDVSGNGSYNKEIGRHLSTIKAILNEGQIAVDLDYYEDEWGEDVQAIYNSHFPIYAPKVDPINMGLHISDAATTDYTISSGAYLCSYKEDGTPDGNTGKLAEKNSYNPSDNPVAIYKAFFEKVSDTNTAYKYKLKVFEVDATEGKLVDKTDNYANYERIINIPKDKVVKNSEGEVIAVKIDALASITSLNNFTAEEIEAYKAIFREIDWFFAYNIQVNGWKNDGTLNYKPTNIASFKDGVLNNYTETVFEGISYYTKLFEECVDTNKSMDERCQKFAELYEELRQDYSTILNDSNFITKNEGTNQKVQDLLELKGLTVEALEEIATMLEFNDDLSVEDVVYVQPYIEKVIKHWYKDIDFSNSNAYTQNTTESFEIPYTPEEEYDANIDIQVVLTPTKGGVYEQEKQPYVIKGDIVLCDGEQQGTVSEVYGGNSTVKDASGKDYTWGDGYRATKKIFTQGYYYTYDGSHATAKSIYFQQEIEDGENTLFRVNVENGAIVDSYNMKYAPKAEIAVGKEGVSTTYEEIVGNNGINEVVLTSKSSLVQKLLDEDGVQVYLVHITEKEDAADRYTYLIYVSGSSMKYLSPTTANQEQVKARVEKINSVWDKIGVVSQRKQVSFDNTTADGESMAKTGLSILKNSGTKDAEYIYRDLKEMLIELGYYTQAEFDQLNIDVLEWFIPAYHPDKWPQNTLEDLDSYTSAILYPYEEPEETDEESTDGTSEESESAYDQLGISADKSKGFTEGLDIIAPADCKIISAEGNTIEIEFDATEQPKISILDGYTMIIQGITLTDEISITDENGNTTVTTLENAVGNGVLIKVGSVIGKTGTEQIKVTLQNDIGRILSNVEDYMAPDTRKMWDGNFSEEFLFHLAFIEGMPIIEDEYFTKANKGVIWGGEELDKNYEENKYHGDDNWFEETVTVGPGLYLKYQADRFRNKGITIKEFESEKENFSYWRYNAQPYKIPKDVTVDVYIELLEEAKASIEKENLDLTQEQFEALLMLRWNVGGNAERYKDVIDIIKNGGDLASVWLKASESGGLDNRRLLEYTLFTTGIRLELGGKEIQITSETPFTDMLEGKSSYTLK